MSTDDEQERLLRALRAPGSDAELAEEERYRTMFRTSPSPTASVTRRRARAPRRLLVGGAAAAVLAVGTGGVAAAYTGNLPSPIQTLAHYVIGAPDASSPPPSSASPVPGAATSSSPAPTAVASSPPSTRRPPAPRRSHEPPRPVPSSRAAAPATASPSATSAAPAPAPAPGSPTDAASPAPTGTPAPVLTGVMVVGASHRVDVGARVPFSGRLTYSGTPVPRQRVVLQQRVGSRWTPVAQGRTDADDSISLTAPPLERTSSFRLVAGRGKGVVRSVAWRVGMHPLVTADVSASKDEATIQVSVMGGSGGDNVTLVTRRDGRLLVVSQARLDASGSASFVVTPDQQRRRYALVLDPTGLHTSARVGVVVRSARGAGGR